MKLLSATALLSALRIGSGLDKVVGAAGAALDNATARVAAELRCDFTRRVAQTDEFYVRPSAGFNYGTFSAPVWKGRFALSNGFLAADPAVTYGTSRAELISAPAAVDAQYLQLNLVRGEVVVHGFDLRAKFVRVTYTSGFVPSAVDATLYVGVEAYPWLVEAAKGFATSELLRTSPSLFMPDKEAGSESAYAPSSRAPERNAASILHSNVRYFPDAIRPAV